MDLKQLEYFVRVAELGSFTRAAQVLGVAQPALSRQVRLLEVELRQNLLTRNGRGATPTEAGQVLLEHGRGILHQVERAREELGRVRSGLSGRVALGLPPSVARVLTVPLTRAFRERLPQAQLSISEGLSTAMQENLLNGRLDIAVLYNASPVAGIELRPLITEELLLVQPRPPGLPFDGSIPALLMAGNRVAPTQNSMTSDQSTRTAAGARTCACITILPFCLRIAGETAGAAVDCQLQLIGRGKHRRKAFRIGVAASQHDCRAAVDWHFACQRCRQCRRSADCCTGRRCRR